MFGNEEEDEMANMLLKVARKGFTLTPQNVRKSAFDYAEKKALEHPFNRETRSVGKDWLRLFLKRHPGLSLRTLQQLSLARAKGLNKEAVTEYFDLLRQTLEDTGSVNSPDHIYNVVTEARQKGSTRPVREAILSCDDTTKTRPRSIPCPSRKLFPYHRKLCQGRTPQWRYGLHC